VAAELCLATGDLAQALTLLDEVIADEATPDRLYRLGLRGEVLLRLGRGQEGMAQLDGLRDRMTDSFAAPRASGEADAAELLSYLVAQRRRIRKQLGLDPDLLDGAGPDTPLVPAFDRERETEEAHFRVDELYDELESDGAPLGLLYWPEDQYSLFVQNWPDLADGYGGDWSGHRTRRGASTGVQRPGCTGHGRRR
jgi:hypothetical protein